MPKSLANLKFIRACRRMVIDEQVNKSISLRSLSSGEESMTVTVRGRIRISLLTLLITAAVCLMLKMATRLMD